MNNQNKNKNDNDRHSVQLSFKNMPNEHKPKRPNEPKTFSSWNYRSKLSKLVNDTSNPLTWKIAFEYAKRGLKQIQLLNKGRSHVTDYQHIDGAISAMKLCRERPEYKHWSISKIAKTYHVNRTTLYRKYRERYGND